MSDIFISFLKNSVRYTELISAITGSIFFYKYRNTSIKYFLHLLWFITFSEFFGWYIRNTGNFAGHVDELGRIYNTWVYNVLGFVTFIVLLYIYWGYLKNTAFKKYLKWFGLIYIVSYILNWIFLQDFLIENAVIPEILGSIFLITAIIFYFIELLRSDKILIFHRMLLFWISIGLLLFYAGTIPFVLEYNGYKVIPGIHKLFLIIYILAILMYFIFTFGFIWSRKE